MRGGKAGPQRVGSVVGKDAEHAQRALTVGTDPRLRRSRTRLYSKDGSRADAADDNGAVGSGGEALGIDSLSRYGKLSWNPRAGTRRDGWVRCGWRTVAQAPDIRRHCRYLI